MVRPRPLRTRSGEPAGVALAGTLEEHIERLDEQLDLLRAQVRQAQQMASLGTLTAMLAHETSNLLAPVLAYAQYTLEHFDEKLARKALERTINNLNVLMSMVSRVHEIGSAKRSAPSTFRVRAIMDRAVESLCREPGKDGITLAIEVEESLTVWADPLQIQQVLFNLLHNARSAMKGRHNGRITLAARREENEVVIEVRDTGPGIDPQRLPTIFDPFETSKSVDGDGRQRVTGLGLALCRELTEENAGSISAESRPGVGTTFTIRLPAEQEDD